MFRWYAVCEGMQHRCDCHGFKGGHHLLSVSNCIPVLEASWATMVTRRSRCLWTPSKAKSTSKIWKLMGQCRLQWPYIIRIGQPTQQTYQATPAPWRPPSSLSGVLQVWLPPTRLPSKDGRGWLWMAYSPISCFPHRALLELAEHQCCWIQVIHGLSQLLMSEANERFTSSIIW